jgi:hypothetical protein
MAGPEFFQTQMGHRFFEGTMPRIADALRTIATQLAERGVSDAPQTPRFVIAMMTESREVVAVDTDNRVFWTHRPDNQWEDWSPLPPHRAASSSESQTPLTEESNVRTDPEFDPSLEHDRPAPEDAPRRAQPQRETMNDNTTEIQQIPKDTMYLHQEIASGDYGNTKFVVDQPLPPGGLIVKIITNGETTEKFYFPLHRVVEQVFELRKFYTPLPPKGKK